MKWSTCCAEPADCAKGISSTSTAARQRVSASGVDHALLRGGQDPQRRAQPAVARQFGNSRDASRTLHRRAGARRVAGGLRRPRGAARASGLLGGARKRQRAAAIPAIPGSEKRREGAAGGRYSANRAEADGAEETGGGPRRRSGRAGGGDLSAQSDHAELRSAAVLLSGQAGRDLLQRRRVVRSVQGRRGRRKGVALSRRVTAAGRR